MKNKKQMIDEYIAKEYPFVITPYQDEEDAGYFGYLLDIPAVVAYEDTKEAVLALLEDARKEWIYYAVENSINIPEPTSHRGIEEFSGRITLRISKTLHMKLANKAIEENVSLNSHIVSVIENGLAISELDKIYSEIKKINESTQKRVSFHDELIDNISLEADPPFAFRSIPRYSDLPKNISKKHLERRIN